MHSLPKIIEHIFNNLALMEYFSKWGAYRHTQLRDTTKPIDSLRPRKLLNIKKIHQ